MKVSIRAACVLFAAAAMGVSAHAAQPHPARSIRYIVLQARGGSLDTLARIVVARMSEALGQLSHKGSPPALIDVLGGRVPLMSSTLAPAMPHARDGKARALAVTGAKRSSAAPDIPTVAESGLPGYEAIAWQGVLAPAGTPREVVQRLHAELAKVIAQQDARRMLAEQGYEPAGTSPEQLGAFIRIEIVKWSKVVMAAGITIE
jgi:tripartite-type tricarboxylate transporter receptor subunit TctC